MLTVDDARKDRSADRRGEGFEEGPEERIRAASSNFLLPLGMAAIPEQDGVEVVRQRVEVLESELGSCAANKERCGPCVSNYR